MNPNLRQVNVCVTITPLTLAMAKTLCWKEGKSLSQKIEEQLAAYVVASIHENENQTMPVLREAP